MAITKITQIEVQNGCEIEIVTDNKDSDLLIVLTQSNGDRGDGVYLDRGHIREVIESLEETYYSIPDDEEKSSEDFIEDQLQMYRDEILNLRADLEKARSTNILKIESVPSQKYDDLKTAYDSLKEDYRSVVEANENLVMSLNSEKVECGNHLNKIHHLEKENESLKEDNRISKNRFSHNVGVYDTLVENHAILANCNAKYKGQINYLKNKVSSLQGQLKHHRNIIENKIFNNGSESVVFNPKDWNKVSTEEDLPVKASARFNLVTVIKDNEVLTKDHSHEALVKNFHSGSLKYWQYDV